MVEWGILLHVDFLWSSCEKHERKLGWYDGGDMVESKTTLLYHQRLFSGTLSLENSVTCRIIEVVCVQQCRTSVGYWAALVEQRPLSAFSHFFVYVCVCVSVSWTGAIGYVSLKVDGPVLLTGHLLPSQSPYSECRKLVSCSIAALSNFLHDISLFVSLLLIHWLFTYQHAQPGVMYSLAWGVFTYKVGISFCLSWSWSQHAVCM